MVYLNYIYYTFEYDTVHEMLVNLQRRLKPTDDIRRLQLTDQYRQLQKSPKNKSLILNFLIRNEYIEKILNYLNRLFKKILLSKTFYI